MARQDGLSGNSQSVRIDQLVSCIAICYYVYMDRALLSPYWKNGDCFAFIMIELLLVPIKGNYYCVHIRRVLFDVLTFLRIMLFDMQI